MGSTLTGQTKASTYDALLKITDNGPVGITEKVVTDGLGNDSAFKVGTAGVSSTGTLASAGPVSVADTTQGVLFTAGSARVGGDATNAWLRQASVGGSIFFQSPSNTTLAAVTTTGLNSTVIGATTPAAATVTALTASTSASLPLATTGAGNVRTTANAVYTANTTMADIPLLTVTLGVGETYYFDADLYLTWSSTGGYKFGFGGTATASTFVASVGADYGTSGGRTMSLVTATSSVVSPTSPSGGGNGLAHVSGTIIVNTGGTFTIQSAQLAATASSTIYAGSTLRVRKIT